MNSADQALFGYLFVIGIVWLVCGAVAGGVGPDRYSGRLFLCTFLFMGPLGIATALIMKAIEDSATLQPADPKPADLTPIKLPPANAKPANDVSAEPTTVSTVEKRTIRCPHCDTNLKVSVDAVRFKCFKCKEISKMPV